MGRIEKKFRDLYNQKRKAFIAYITAGDPSLEATVNLVKEFDKQGVDIIELGVPFSDPVADGHVNQEASMRALKNNVSVGDILGAIREIRKNSGIPIIFFAYFNTILAYGLERFVHDASDSGLDGALVLDLPPEEAEEYKKLMDSRNLATIFLVSPITPAERLNIIAEYATGFMYYVSQMGVTGERDSIAGGISENIREIKAQTDVPVVVGFGISSPDHVREVAQHADGVVVGSAIVKRIGESGRTRGFERIIGHYVGTLTSALKGAENG